MTDQTQSTNNYYTVVIDALPPEIYKDTLRPKATLQTDTGIQVFNKDGSPQLQYFDETKHGKIEDNLTT